MRPKLVKYDPVKLSEALVKEFYASDHEIFNELKNLGMGTDEGVAWLLGFSFAYSTKHQKISSKVFEGLKFAPEIAERFAFPSPGLQTGREEKLNERASGKEDSDVGKLGDLAVGVIDGIPPAMAGFAQAASVLGMSVLSLELSRFMLAKGQYDHFVSLLMVARELFAAWRLNLKGMADKKRIASANALKGHVATYCRCDEIIKYWSTHISPTLSNEMAADILLKQFTYPAHRTMKEYVAVAKRKLISC
jgi:hypothetical protein